MRLFVPSILAIATIHGAAPLAVAIPVNSQTTSSGDLILNVLGPATPGNTAGLANGTATDLTVDLGPSTAFTTSAVIPIGGLTLADLESTFGTNFSSAGLLWGALGATKSSGFGGAQTNTLWLTVAAPTPGTSTLLAALPAGGGSQAVQVGKASALYVHLPTVAATPDSASAGIEAASTTNSFASLDGSNGTNSSFGLSGSVDGTIGSSSPFLDLYSVVAKSTANPNGIATLLGTFSLDTNAADPNFGKTTFTGINAVPEPATASLLLLGASLVGMRPRRRS